MVGKKNVVFGFLFLVLTAALGPLMVIQYQDWAKAAAQKQQLVGQLQELKAGDYQDDPQTLEELTPKQLGVMNTEAILAMNLQGALQQGIDAIKGGPHAHGNLEALLNIVVGIALAFIAAPRWLKQTASWLFILGTLLHSGLLYLERVFQLGWAGALLNTGIGPLMLLLGLLLMGALALKGWRAQPLGD
jgi:uncharacterized membrane protein YgdD (TMEM256/DUF423 family)